MPIISPAEALWNHRLTLVGLVDRARQLQQAVGRSTDLVPYQWAQLLAFTLEFQPDLVLEFGRERGNSTTCFLEAARLLAPQKQCQVLSLCLTDLWQRETAPKLARLCTPEWFGQGQILTHDLLTYDFEPWLRSAPRCLIFWDAHGFDIAEHVLGHILPSLEGRPHVVVLHDMSDTRYDGQPRVDYDEQGLWKGERDSGARFWLGTMVSHVAQAVSVMDFTTRNRIPLHPAGESLHQLQEHHPERTSALRELLGDEFFSLAAHWFWFSTQEAPGHVVYPPVQQTASRAPESGWNRLRPRRVLARLRKMMTSPKERNPR